MTLLRKAGLALGLFTLAVFSFPENVSAQAPNTINYQAVARDTSGAPLANQSLDITITIIDSIVFVPVYTESWPGVTTNRFGLFTIQIGRGTTVDDFSAVDWAGGGLYLQVEVDGVVMGNATELTSVPFALYAESAGNVLVIDSAALNGTNYIIYTNQGNDTTDMSGLAGAASSIDSGKVVGTDTLRIYQGGNVIDIDVSNLSGGTSLDNDTTNEIQFLSLNDDTLFISDGNNIVLPDADATNEKIDSLVLDGTLLKIYEGGQLIDSAELSGLGGGSAFEDTLVNAVLVGTDLHLIDATNDTVTADLSGLVASTASDSVSSLALNGTTLVITSEDGDTVQANLASLIATDSVQSLALNGTTLVITSEDGDTVQTNLAPLIATDSVQSLALNGTTLVITSEDGDTVQANLGSLIATDSVQSLALNGTTLVITSEDGDTVQANLASLITTDSVQSLALNGTTLVITSEDGDTVQANLASLIATDSVQSLALNGTTLVITSEDGDTVQTNLAPLIATDSVQSLALNGTTLVITSEDGDTVQANLGSLIATDSVQSLALNGTTLVITSEDGDTVQANLASLITTDSVQSLALNGTTLVITSEDGDTVQANLASLIATDSVQSLALNGTTLVITSEDGDTVQANLASLIATDSVQSLDLQGTNLVITSEDGDTVQADLALLFSDTSNTNELDTFNFAGVVGDSLMFVYNGDTVHTIALSEIATTGSVWTENNDSVYVLNKNVGIGIAAPEYLLHLQSTSHDTSAYINTDVATTDVIGMLVEASNTTGGTGTQSQGLRVRASGAITNTGIRSIVTSPGSSTAGTARGLWGTALNGPSFLNIGVYGEAGGAANNRGVQGALNENLSYTTSDAGVYGIGKGTGDVIGVFGRAIGTSNTSGIHYGIYTRAENASENYAAYFESGAVYVGDSLIIPTNAGNGKVLTSDNNGVARWESPGSGDDGDWDTTATALYTTKAVGIGTSTPGALIHADGDAVASSGSRYGIRSSVDDGGNGSTTIYGIHSEPTSGGGGSNTYYGVYSKANVTSGGASSIGLYSFGSEYSAIFEGGSVGVLNDHPDAQFQVDSTLVIDGSSPIDFFGNNMYYDGSDYRHIKDGYASAYAFDSDFSGLFLWPSGTAGSIVDNDPDLTLKLEDSTFTMASSQNDTVLVVKGGVVMDSLIIKDAYGLPASDGTSGQVLTTNGAGVLGWSSLSAGSSKWTNSGANTYLSTGSRLGVGTNSPHAGYVATLYVNGGGSGQGGLFIDNSVNGNTRKEGVYSRLDDDGNLSKKAFRSYVDGKNSGNDTLISFESTIRNDNASDIAFGLYSDFETGVGTNYGVYSINEDFNYFSGNVGIGTTNPSNKLTLQTSGTAYGFKHTNGSIDIESYIDATYGAIGTTTNHPFYLYMNDGNPLLTLTSTTSVAIGNNHTTATSTLDVAGDIETGSSDAFYFGDPSTDGTWRIKRSGNNLVFERRESGSWVTKTSMVP